MTEVNKYKNFILYVKEVYNMIEFTSIVIEKKHVNKLISGFSLSELGEQVQQDLTEHGIKISVQSDMFFSSIIGLNVEWGK